MAWSITRVDGGHWVARERDAVSARITFKGAGACEVTFPRMPEFDYEFAAKIGTGCDEMRLERAIGYVRGVERAVNVNVRAENPPEATVTTSKRVRPFPTAAAAQLAGFTVDHHCYPWVAYKGPRFRPTEWHVIDTDDEAMLRGVAGGAMDVIHTVVRAINVGDVDRAQMAYLREAVQRMGRALDREPSIIESFPGRKS